MFTSQSPTRQGLLAGGIAMMIALLAMQLVSRVIGPWLLLTDYLASMVLRNLIGLTGELARFLLSGHNVIRATVSLMVLFLIAGAYLGKWVAQNPGELNQRVMQAAAMLFFLTMTVLYLLESGMLEYYLQEFLLTLAISWLVFAVVLHRLLELNSNENRWRIASAIAAIGFVVIIYDAWVR